MDAPNQNLTLPPKASLALPLKESKEGAAKLDTMLMGCFAVQKLYGRDTANAGEVTRVFHATLANFPAEKVVRAFETWIGRSEEFPTPAGIINLIKRNGKPPLSESMYIQISKKACEDRTPEDWQYLRDYQADQQDGWADSPDPRKESATAEENRRLRQELADLRTEYERLADLLRAERAKKTPMTPQLTISEKVQRTVETMRADGVPEEDVQAFIFSAPAQPTA
jgi:hypothetical protein